MYRQPTPERFGKSCFVRAEFILFAFARLCECVILFLFHLTLFDTFTWRLAFARHFYYLLQRIQLHRPRPSLCHSLSFSFSFSSSLPFVRVCVVWHTDWRILYGVTFQHNEHVRFVEYFRSVCHRTMAFFHTNTGIGTFGINTEHTNVSYNQRSHRIVCTNETHFWHKTFNSIRITIFYSNGK